MISDDELQSAFQKAQVSEPIRTCATEERLVRVASGEATQSERLQLIDHLTTCGRCAEEYRLIVALKPWADESKSILHPEAPRPADAGAMPRRALSAVAASLLVSFAVGSSFGAWWQQRQSSTAPPAQSTSVRSAESRAQASTAGTRAESEQQLADARRQVSELTRRIEDQERQKASMREAREAPAAPEPNVPIVDLEPADAVRGDADRARSIELPSSARLVTFVANTADRLPAGSYAIDMTDPRDRMLWTISGVHPSAYNTLTLAVPRALLPPGVAHIRVYRLRDGRKEVVQEYRVRFAYR